LDHQGIRGKKCGVKSSVLDPDPNPHEFAMMSVCCIRIQVGKNGPKTLKKVKKFIVLKCSLLRAGRLLKYSSLDVFY
jgi:hypothetical protein